MAVGGALLKDGAHFVARRGGRGGTGAARAAEGWGSLCGGEGVGGRDRTYTCSSRTRPNRFAAPPLHEGAAYLRSLFWPHTGALCLGILRVLARRTALCALA